MDYEIILHEFNKIKEKGWIKTIRRGPTGVGATLEYLLEIKENQLSYPDFFGYEIKSKRKENEYYTTLFNCSPIGPTEFENNRLRENYGYPDRVNKDLLVMNVSLSANTRNNIGIKYKAELFVNRDTQTLNLFIYNNKGTLVDWHTKWTFDMLKEKLFNKCSTLVFIKAERKYMNKEEYFKYSEMNIYKLKDFDTFIDLIEKGYIRVSFKIGIFRSGPRIGQTHDHGTGFEIIEKNLEKLYKKVY